MAVIGDYYIGRTHITVTDDYMCKEEEIPVIIERISKKASLALQAEANRKAQQAAIIDKISMDASIDILNEAKIKVQKNE